ncbi:hypothetical protein ACVWXL_007894 [Bradyrhizobium sp. GM22.5]
MACISARVRWATRSSSWVLAAWSCWVEDDVVEGDREPAGEDLDQRAVGLGQLALGLQQHHDLAAASGAQIDHAAVVGEFVLAALERGFHHRAQIGVERLRRGGADEAAVAAAAGEHRELGVDAAIVAQNQDTGAIDVEQRGKLGQYALGEPLHRLEIVQRRSRVDDDLEPAPCLQHALELLVGAQRRGQRGEQLVGGELGLRFVVVDVVLHDHAPFRRLTGLSGAQDDAHGLVLELVADVLDQLEAGDVRLHDDVEQHGGDVVVRGHQLATFGRGMGGEDLQALAVEGIVRERKTRTVMHGRIVVDDGDLPFPGVNILRCGTGVVDQVEDIVLFGH